MTPDEKEYYLVHYTTAVLILRQIAEPKNWLDREIYRRTPELQAMEDARKADAEHCIKKCKEAIIALKDSRQREILWLHYIDGKPWERIALDITHYSLGTIYNIRREALRIIEICK